jgi:GNAT superfamily N-acetyltransferase
MEIRPITPALVGDYLNLFDAAFYDNPYWVGCYCAFYDDPVEGWDPGPKDAGVHRSYKAEQIMGGHAHGLLAYEDGQPVGWCNVGPKSHYVNLRHYRDVPDHPGEVVGLVMCFVVHPDHRRRAVAASLLSATDGYLASFGVTIAESYPRAAPPEDPDVPWTAHYYKGSKEMYQKAGYRQVSPGERFLVMQKRLAMAETGVS